MNKQVIEYVEVNIGLVGTSTRTMRNPLLSWGRPRIRIIGTVFYDQSMPDLQASYLMKNVKGMEFFNHSRSYWK